MIYLFQLLQLLRAALIFSRSCLWSVSAMCRVQPNCHQRPAGVIPRRTRCHGSKSVGSVQSCCSIWKKVDPEWCSAVSSKGGKYCIEKLLPIMCTEIRILAWVSYLCTLVFFLLFFLEDTNQTRRVAALLGLPKFLSEDSSDIIKMCDVSQYIS